MSESLVGFITFFCAESLMASTPGVKDGAPRRPSPVARSVKSPRGLTAPLASP